MASEARHILIARDKGMEAGMDAFLNGKNVARLSPAAYQDISRKRTPATKLAAYCAHFAEKVGEQQEQDDTDVSGESSDLLEKVANLLQSLGIDVSGSPALSGGATVGTVETTEESDLVTDGTFITMDAAWAALGRGIDRPKATRRGEPASNGQLYRMNTLGIFSPEEVARINDEAQTTA